MEITEITEDNFQTEVTEAGRPVLLEFYSNDCSFCKAQLSVLEEAAKEAVDVKFCKINAAEAPELAERYGILTLPAMFIQNGEEIYKTISGFRPLEAILAYLEM